MNANELADELERLYQQDIIDGVADLSMPEAATMLRQQQAEIEALKKEAALQRLFDFTQEADNEPVAWINLNRFKDEALYLADCVSETKVDNMGITTPLYTHPQERPHNTVLVPCDKLAEMQAEIEELKAKLQLHEAMDNQCASLMQQFRKASKK